MQAAAVTRGRCESPALSALHRPSRPGGARKTERLFKSVSQSGRVRVTLDLFRAAAKNDSILDNFISSLSPSISDSPQGILYHSQSVDVTVRAHFWRSASIKKDSIFIFVKFSPWLAFHVNLLRLFVISISLQQRLLRCRYLGYPPAVC